METESNYDSHKEEPAGVAELEEFLEMEIGLGEDVLPLPLDTGYAWVIMVASMMNNFIVDGIANVFGLLLVDFVDYFQADKATISLIGSLLCGVYLMIGPIAGALVNKYGCRPVCICGSVIGCLAFILSSFAPSILVLTFTYGVLGGIGFGFIYLPSIVCVSFYFQKHRAMAVGVSVCGTGIGTMVMSPVTQLLLENYGWQNTLLILSGFILNSAVFGALLKPNEPKMNSSHANNSELENNDMTKNRRRLVSEMSVDHERLKQGLKAARAKRLRTITQTADSVTEPPTPIHRLAVQYVEAARMEAETEDSKDENLLETIPEKMDLPKISENGRLSELPTISENAKTPKKTMRSATSVEYEDVKYSTTNNNEDSRMIYSMQSLSTNKLGKSNKILNANSGFNLNNMMNGLSVANLEDIKRPLYQKDIFYSRSVMNLASSKLGKSAHELYPSTVFLSMARIPGEIVEQEDTDSSPTTCYKLKKIVGKPIWDALVMMIDCSLLKNRSYLIVWFANLLGMLSFYIPIIFINDFARDSGVNESQAAWLISSYGIWNTLGRVCFGWLAGLPRLSPLAINNVTLVISGCLVAALALCKSFWSILITFSVLGVFMAPFICLTSEILCQMVGLDALTNAFGLITLARGISSCIGAPFAGTLYTPELCYTLPFIMGGILFILSAAIYAILHLPHFKQQTKENQKDLATVYRSALSLNNSVLLVGGSQLVATSNGDLIGGSQIVINGSMYTVNNLDEEGQDSSKLLSNGDLTGNEFFEETV